MGSSVRRVTYIVLLALLAPATLADQPTATAPTTRLTAPSITRPALVPAATAVKSVPEGLDDLRTLQTQVKAVLERVAPTVVGLRVGFGQGSGVIISEDGYVLTAGH